MVSRLLGFTRDILLAVLLGAGVLADAFFVAFKLPNFFRRMLAEGTLTVALIPVLARQRQAGEGQAHAFLDALASLLLLLLLLLSVAGVALMPWLLLLFAPGFHDEPNRWSQALLLARWMFPYLALISLAAMGWAVLNAYRRFAVAAASPALLNLAIIAAALLLAPSMANPALALAFGVLAGGALQLAIQIPALRRIGWRPRLSLAWRQPAIGETLRLFVPALMGVAAVQLNILIGTILATLLPVGAVSYLYYADRIVQLPLALFGIAMGSALLPALSAMVAEGRRGAAQAQLQQGLGWLTWITLPATVGLFMLARPVVETLFVHGRFTHGDAVATAHTLQAYALGLIPFCWAKVLGAACFADRQAKAPMHYAMVGVAVNLLLALLLMGPLAWVGLALATSLAALANALLLARKSALLYGRLLVGGVAWRIGKAAAASLIMAGWLKLICWRFPFPLMAGWPEQGGWLAAVIASALVVFGGSAWIMGERIIPRPPR
ncbi:MAG: murein biosynthesis integral membrane protein MurJ [Zetaproteobacteria bacterium]|nr:MAG: murein biosynthesis integral membrane protein MurJ [Zetaproteobacteria bacterium]